ncbi:MAG TPA: hypothetical protein VD706_00840, partial [Candidatus Saccharimonadales bacterium]|nr:hypothetical protein [Candidatus Saccharimonadales bacterium]
MPIPEEFPMAIEEDLEDPLQFRNKFETEKWRLINGEDGKFTFIGGMAGLLAGTSLNAYLHGDSDSTLSSINPVRE